MIAQLQKKQVTGANPLNYDSPLTPGSIAIAVFRHNVTGMTTPYQPLSSSGLIPLVQALGADNYIGIFGKTVQAGESQNIPANSVSGTLGVELMEYKSDQGILVANYADSDVPASPGPTLSLGSAPSRAAKNKERLLLVASSTNGGHNQAGTPPWTNGFVEQDAMNLNAGTIRGSVAHLIATWSASADVTRGTSYSLTQTTYRIVGAMLELYVPESVSGPGEEVAGVGLKFDSASGTWKDANFFVADMEDVPTWR